ncbi:MAG: hypothetical protein LH468_05540 [Nocardioides sp.]|nr:hypothetical protein [Nocardioides sp.]
MRPLPRLSAVLTTGLATGLATVLVTGLALVGPQAATAVLDRPATPVILKPTQLPRGGDVAVPHIEGTTVVDGSTRIPVTGSERVTLLGRSGAGYVVAAFDDQGRQHVLRATTSGVTPLVRPSRKGDLVQLSADGTRLAQAASTRGTRTRVRVWDAGSGALVGSRTLTGSTTLLDLDGSRVLLHNDVVATQLWSPDTDAVTAVSKRRGYRADIAADRLATFDRDPFDGGCTVVSRLSKPGKPLWRSCNERVESWSGDGRRMATVDLLSDGIGPSQVLVRGAGGASKAVYRIRGYFGLLTWESAKALLLEAYGRKKGATLRCTGATCVRASDLVPTPQF